MAGLAASALAALYPPVHGSSPSPAARYSPAAPAMPQANPLPAVPASPAASQQNAAAPPNSGVRPDGPAFGSTVRGVIAFAGGAAPLPAGDWLTVGAIGGKGPAGRTVDAVLLAQLEDGKAKAILELTGVRAPEAGVSGFPRVTDCQESRNIYSRVFVARDDGEQACWSVDAVALKWDGGDRLLASGSAEIRQRGAALPDLVLRARFVRANTGRLLLYNLYRAAAVGGEGLAGWDWSHIMAAPQRLATMGRWRDWAVAWWPLVDGGFAGRLRPADPVAASANAMP